MKSLLCTLILTSNAFTVIGQDPDSGHAYHKGNVMGSSLEIEIFGVDQETCDRALKDALQEINRIDRMMTDWKAESPLMNINHNAGKKPVSVPDDLYLLIERSVQLSRLTEGAFDITFAGAGKLWNWRAPSPEIPEPGVVQKALQNVGWDGIQLNKPEKSVFLKNPGMRIGLGAIAPGYAGDRAIRKIRSHGIRNAMVNMSGEILAIGLKNGETWKIGIRHPRKEDENIAMIPLSNLAIATSGDYERYFIKNGKRYCHIIDPRTGYPANLCQSVTITAPHMVVADALSTAVFVLGPEKGMALIEKMEGVEGMIVDTSGNVHVSPGLKK
jgi:thiamine biosynthesis lipoprotein